VKVSSEEMVLGSENANAIGVIGVPIIEVVTV
jgi:hypothetical protein